MASRILYNNGEEIDLAISGAYPNIILRGSGFVRDTGVQNVSGQKFFYDTITFYSALHLTGDFVPSGNVIGNLYPQTTNVFSLGSPTQEWKHLYLDGTGRIDNLHVDSDASVTGNLSVFGDFTPANIATHLIPKTNNTYDLGSESQQFRNLHIDGTGRIDSLHVDENLSVSGSVTVFGASTLSLTNTAQLTATNITTTGSTSLGVTTAQSVTSTGNGSFGRLFVTGTGIPATQTSVGTRGEIVYGGGYLYVCTGTNLWGRTHLTGWT
jgi:hypothetical protein